MPHRSDSPGRDGSTIVSRSNLSSVLRTDFTGVQGFHDGHARRIWMGVMVAFFGSARKAARISAWRFIRGSLVPDRPVVDGGGFDLDDLAAKPAKLGDDLGVRHAGQADEFGGGTRGSEVGE
jgi:hypothetical protein